MREMWNRNRLIIGSRHRISHLCMAWGAALLCLPGSVQASEISLGNLVRTALAYHPQLRGQQNRQQAASAAIEAARWDFWPTPSATVEKASTSASDLSYGKGDSMVTYLRLQQPLWTGGRLTGGLSKAQAKANTSEADLQDTRQQLSLRVLQAWSDALVANEKLQAYERALVLHKRLLGLVERRQNEGASAQADVALASSRVSTLQSDMEAVRVQLQTALDTLRSMTGLKFAGDILPQARLLVEPLRASGLEALMSGARENSPQLSKAQAAVQAALADIEIAKSSLSPEFYARLERQYGSFQMTNQAAQSRIFVGLSTSFGGGLSRLSGVDSAVAQHQAALDDLQNQQLTLEEQITKEHALVQAAQLRRAGLETSIKGAAEVAESYERQFLAGRKQWLDLVNSARELAQSEVQLADVIGAQHLSAWKLAIFTRGTEAVFEAATNLNANSHNTKVKP